MKNVNVAVAGAGKETAVAELPRKIKFGVTIMQVANDGMTTQRGMSFELDPDKAVQPDIIVGTLMKRIFDDMDMAKAAKVKFLDSRLPIQIKVSSQHFDLDFGKVEEWFAAKLKANSSSRSKLAFLDRLILVVNKMMTPVEGIRATVLAEDLRIAAIEHSGKEVKRLANEYHNRTLASTVLVVKEDGELEETPETEAPAEVQPAQVEEAANA